MANARELLRKWLKEKDLTQADLSRRSKSITEGMLSHYLSEDPKTRRNPGLANALEIAVLTGNAVPADSWVETSPAKSRRRGAAKSAA